MTSTFWIDENNLDTYQLAAIEGIPESQSFLLTGPAGSGKTNILLLRSRWLAYKRISNIKIVVFTSALKEFIHLGCDQYQVPTEDICTSLKFFADILNEYKIPYSKTGDFDTDRQMFAGKVSALISDSGIGPIFQALLIDEAQDYTDTELNIFRSLAEVLILACDSRQSIYQVSQSPDILTTLTHGNHVELRFHYRSGHKICRVAESIFLDKVTYPPISDSSKYNERTQPSLIDYERHSNFENQATSIIGKLENELLLYPNEKIGILFPKANKVSEFQQYLDDSGLSEEQLDQIVCLTLHSSKGWEFRSVHIAGCEDLYKMGSGQKRLIYTGILRGKTSVQIYSSSNLPGYLKTALESLDPPPSNPPTRSLFGGGNARS